MSDNLWACRTTGPAEVLAALPMKDKRVAALPAGDTPRVLEAFKDMLPLASGGNVLETALNSPNVVTHVAGCVPNAAGIDRSGGNFAFFRDGLSASVIKCSAAVEAERDAVLERLGLKAPIDGGLCLGEGTGAMAFMPMISMAADIYQNMGTFQDIDIKEYVPLS